MKADNLPVEFYVEVTPFNPDSSMDLQVHLWPQGTTAIPSGFALTPSLVDLRVSQLRSASLQDLQAFAKANQTPFVVFNPAAGNNASPANTTHFNSIVAHLHGRQIVSTLPLPLPLVELSVI